MTIRLLTAALLLTSLLGCEEAQDSAQTDPGTWLDRDALLDPQTCQPCHPDAYREWSGSMHAYASTDPVFRAMNARGQRETDGELGDFCVGCHAPMAVREGATTDGLNMDEVPQRLQGVTCYFCHTVESVEGTHNNPLALAGDTIMRGGIEDPVLSAAHPSAWSTLHDRDQRGSSDLCGACHDIVTPRGVHIERTYLEWQESLYAHDEPDQGLSCNACHMRGRDGLAADADGVFLRRVHSHTFAGVDTALTDFPEKEAQLEEIQRLLDTSLIAELCVFPEAGVNAVHVILENVAAGHSFPSGAAQDRRVWVELIAYDATDATTFQSGVLAPDQALVDLEDPQLFRIGDYVYDEQGDEVHMFWDIASYRSELLPAPTALSPLDPDWTDTHVTHVYSLPGPVPDRITMRVRMRSMGLDLLDDLIQSGDLDPALRDAIPTFNLAATTLEWRAEDGKSCVPF